MARLRDHGLCNVVASWIGQDNNLELTLSQIIAVFGTPTLQELADKTGLDLQVVSSLITSILPVIAANQSCDDVQTKRSLLSKGISLLKSRLLG